MLGKSIIYKLVEPSWQRVRLASHKILSKANLSVKEARSVVTPYVELDTIIKDSSSLEMSLTKRQHTEDLNELKKMWISYKSLLGERKDLEDMRETNRLSLVKLKSEPNTSSDIEHLKSTGKNLREKFKDVVHKLTLLENILIPRVLNLPNNLSPEVPDSPLVFKSCLKPMTTEYDHLSTGAHLGILKYFDNYMYYFCDIAATYELAVCNFIARRFNGLGFLSLSNPDFSRLPLVEGWINQGIQSHLLPLDKSFWVGEHGEFFLNGGAHFLMFCGLHVNSSFDRKCLPIKYVSQGRCYYPDMKNSLPGLFSVYQNTCVNFFIGADELNSSLEFDNIVDALWDFYKKLKIPVQLVYSPSSELLPPESLRVSIQIFSSSNNRFVEVGSVSKIDDFVSRRLRMYYRDNEDFKFIHVIHGTAIKVPVIVACLLENHPEESLSLFKQHINIFDC